MLEVRVKVNEFLEIETDNKRINKALKKSKSFIKLHPWDEAYQYVPRDEKNLKDDKIFNEYEDYVIHIIERLSKK